MGIELQCHTCGFGFSGPKVKEIVQNDKKVVVDASFGGWVLEGHRLQGMLEHALASGDKQKVKQAVTDMGLQCPGCKQTYVSPIVRNEELLARMDNEQKDVELAALREENRLLKLAQPMPAAPPAKPEAVVPESGQRRSR